MSTIVSSKLDALTDRNDVGMVQRAANAQLDDDNVAQEHAGLYVRLLEKLNRNEARAYVLVLVGDLIKDERRLKLIEPASTSLLNLLTSTNDEFIRLKSAATLCLLPDLPTDLLSTLLTHLARLLGPAPPISSAASSSSSSSGGDSDPETQLVAVQCLCTVFRASGARHEAWRREDRTGQASESNGKASDEQDGPVKVVFGLVALLKQIAEAMAHMPSASGRSTPRTGASTPNPAAGQSTQAQLAYYLGFSFWLLSFERQFCESVNGKYGVLIPLLTELARNAVKEKVVRVVLACFRNLATLSPGNNLPAMLAARLQPYLQQLATTRKWSDEDIKEDVEFLSNELKEAKQRMTTYDEYSSELESGRLRWTPPHESADFWRENASKLQDKDDAQLRALLDLLYTSKDNTVLAVACSDIGQYIQYCDAARKHIDKLGGKSRIMALLQHPDADVKYYSLQTVQRLISQPWTR